MSFCTGFNLGFLTVTSLFRAKSCKQSVCSHILGFFGVQNRLNLPIRVNGLIFKKQLISVGNLYRPTQDMSCAFQKMLSNPCPKSHVFLRYSSSHLKNKSHLNF